MRLADGPGTGADIHVAAAPERVWDLVSDITTPTRFGGELYEAEWLDGATGPALGATFVGRNRNELLGGWETVSRVSDHRPGTAFAWQVGGMEGDFDRPVATWSFELAPEGDGTRLRHSVTIGPGTSYLTKMVEAEPEREEELVAFRLDMLERGIRATLDGVRKLAES
ncbi:hypothetical protein AC230_03515 [Streptomyces caatingaensis]|uniref:Cyclase n=2 Tax=Streptomyces caatingaensis TaxID=1678637 RepID=A0A0K9XK82_9ACTN|nr:hypothetical protein AC230_03515 [Streptomyces caatingaensis]